MVTEVKMPRLGVTMKQGTIGKWLKKEGDRVEKGDVLFEVETEKLTKRVEASACGVLRKIVFPEKRTVPVATTIALLGEPDEPLPEVLESVPGALGMSPTEHLKTAESAKPAIETSKDIRVSPVARKLAQEYGIDVTGIQGTGPGGRIVREDILKTVAASRAEPVSFAKGIEVQPISTIRRVTAERMSKSHLTAAHVTITNEVDVTEMMRLRQAMLPEIERAAGVRISYNDMIVKAVSKALNEYSYLNSTLDEDCIKISRDIHIGIAVSLDQGLMVVVIRDADKKSLVEISKATKELVDKARQGTISLDEVSGSTFTITNLGIFGVEIFTPIINFPETAILGIGRIAEKPVVMEGQIVVRSMMYLSLSFDHRIIDGAPAAKFLERIKQILENPHLILT